MTEDYYLLGKNGTVEPLFAGKDEFDILVEMYAKGERRVGMITQSCEEFDDLTEKQIFDPRNKPDHRWTTIKEVLKGNMEVGSLYIDMSLVALAQIEDKVAEYRQARKDREIMRIPDLQDEIVKLIDDGHMYVNDRKLAVEMYEKAHNLDNTDYLEEVIKTRNQFS